MAPPKTYLLYVCLLLQVSVISVAQDRLPDPASCVELLSEKVDPDAKSYDKVFYQLNRLDSADLFPFIHQLEQKGKFANGYFKSKLNILTAYFKAKYHQYQSKSECIRMNEAALNYAYETGDDHFIAFICFKCGSNSLFIHEMELAATYLLKGQELYDGFDPPVKRRFTHWILLGEVLFHCREYEKSIFYTHKAIKEYQDKGEIDVMARFNNTIGQSYDRLGNLDSAIHYYDKSMEVSQTEVWKAINAGYIGELYFSKKEYTKAKPLLEYNYMINRTREYDHAAKSLQVLAAIDLAMHKNDSAVVKIREALALIKKSGTGYYLQPLSFLERIYFTASDVYRAMGNADSFYVYSHLYLNLHDSLQRVSLLISTKMAQLRIDNDNNLRGIQMLQREKQTAAVKRNFIILSVLLGSIILLLYFNRLRLKQKHRQEFALQQKNAAETELQAAKEQMQLITENIIEKTELIEKLSRQLSHKEQNSEQHQLINEITHQTILTEEDWENFKNLFEKIYPGFFLNLKEKARDITIAEQRMAALTRLNLTARQMATMLGISVDSVHKSRQRLRQRLHIPVEVNLEESVASL